MIESSDRYETPHEKLSASGAARRDAMLGELLGELSRTTTQRKRRRIAGRTAAALMLVAAGMLMIRTMWNPHPAAPTNLAGNTGESGAVLNVAAPHGAKAPAIRITRIGTDAGARRRYVVDTPPIVVRIDDETLMDDLEAMGRPAGLIRMGGKTRLAVAMNDRSSKR